MNIDLTKTNKLIDWLKNMLYINTKVNLAGKRVVYRGQVYFCELGEGIGSEECKERPCIILQNNVGKESLKIQLLLLLQMEVFSLQRL